MRWSVLLFVPLLAGCAAGQGSGGFYLNDGDRVVFYGDSITQQRLYTTFAETYAVTRFPNRTITFVHSGWGGDRVDGGRGGSIDLRLERDVIAHRPNVVTVMLGMNDGTYRPFDQAIFDRYSKGYTALLGILKSRLPGVRITAIEPSPYDDITRPPMGGGGYNAVLVRMGAFLRELAAKEKLDVADLNGPVVAMLKKANAADHTLAGKIVPDRVHPAASGHLIMAQALLKAWGAPAVVSAVEIDAAAKKVIRTQNAKVNGLSAGAAITWAQKDEALPMAVDMDDPATALAVKSADFVQALNQQPLKVTGLPAGHWALRVDGRLAGVFHSRQWAEGVNLATLPTPMVDQAAAVHALTLRHNNIHFTRWRDIQVTLADEGLAKVGDATAALNALEQELVAKQRAAARPVEHKFELTRSSEDAASLPPGFERIFNGADTRGWHISQVNHHGQTKAWTVENGVLKGTQDQPGHGGIMLTDRQYRNFEVSIEVNPDFGCDSGLFLRANEKGQAYQVMLDYLEGGNVGGIYGERLEGVRTVMANYLPHWKKGQWNHLRARIEGTIPHIRVWLNGERIIDYYETANHAADGATGGMIAVQVHRGNRWTPGGYHRFRNIAVRELP
ncbi:MAG: family 16 glycoside hydrolase [Bryobacteraceae bacterium]|nr:family 16 glycoside hydrolase [Bryobacteraceae bacterium]